MMDAKRAIETCNTQITYNTKALQLLPVIEETLKKYDGKVMNANLRRKLEYAIGETVREVPLALGVAYDIMFTYTMNICILHASTMEDIADKNEKGNWRLNYKKASKILNKHKEHINRTIKTLEYTKDNYEDIANRIHALHEEISALLSSLHYCVW